jgi:hypothetical protein
LTAAAARANYRQWRIGLRETNAVVVERRLGAMSLINFRRAQRTAQIQAPR